MPWAHDAIQCRVGGYLVTAPASDDDRSMFVTRDGRPVVLINQGSEVDVFRNAEAEGDDHPVASLQDRDDDGSFDFLTYEIRDVAGAPIGDVVDGDLDGDPDSKIVRSDGVKAYARVGGTWREIRTVGDRREALIDGRWKPVRLKRWTWEAE